MAMTLAEQAKLEQNPLRRGVIQGLLEASYSLQRIPFEHIGGLNITVVRWAALPSVGFRRVNEGYSESTGAVEQLQEAVYDLGGDIDVDSVLVRDRNAILDPRALQTRMKLRAIAYEFQDRFINGDQAVDPQGFNGIKVRLASLPASQTIDKGEIDLTPVGIEANKHKLLDALHELIYACDGHEADLLLMNDRTYLAISSALRRAGLLDQTRDMFDRQINTFHGAALVDVGVKADQVTKIISDTHDGDGLHTSIYAVKLGVGEYLHGIEEFKLDVRDLGELEGKPVFRTRIQWPVGIAVWNKRSLARLKNIKVV